ncbi:hypothetical protein [Senegalia massiliensis]|nr:hypothetical protein [Senegalia massiliensis]
MTDKKFNKSKCKNCIWRTKIDSNTYYCMLPSCSNKKKKGDKSDSK